MKIIFKKKGILHTVDMDIQELEVMAENKEKSKSAHLVYHEIEENCGKLEEIAENKITNQSKSNNVVDINENIGTEEIKNAIRLTNADIKTNLKYINEPNTKKTINGRSTKLNNEENNEVYAKTDQNNTLSNTTSSENKGEYKSCIVQIQEVHEKTAFGQKFNSNYICLVNADPESIGFKFIKKVYRKKASVGTTSNYDVEDIDNQTVTSDDAPPPQLSHYSSTRESDELKNTLKINMGLDRACKEKSQSKAKLSISEETNMETNDSNNQEETGKEVTQTRVTEKEDTKKMNEEHIQVATETNANTEINNSTSDKKENKNPSKGKKTSKKMKKMSASHQAKVDRLYARKLHVELNRQEYRRRAKK